jgi:hypothetical protein
LIDGVGRTGGQTQAAVDALIQPAAKVRLIEQFDGGHIAHYEIASPNLQTDS